MKKMRHSKRKPRRSHVKNQRNPTSKTRAKMRFGKSK